MNGVPGVRSDRWYDWSPEPLTAYPVLAPPTVVCEVVVVVGMPVGVGVR